MDKVREASNVGGIPFGEKISCSINDAVAASSLSRSTIYEMIREGTIESRRVGSRRLVNIKSLRRFLEGDKSDADAERAA